MRTIWRASDNLPSSGMEPPVRFERTTFALPRRRSNRWSYEGVIFNKPARAFNYRQLAPLVGKDSNLRR